MAPPNILFFIAALYCGFFSGRVCADDGDLLEYDLVEGTASGTEIVNLITAANLASVYGNEVDNLQFSFLPQSSAYVSYFNIDPSSGLLSTDEVIDRDVVCEGQVVCDMLLHVGVLTPELNVDTILVTIHITDLNDNPPQFIPNRHDLSISETAAQGTLFTLPTAYDPDSELRGIQSYSLREPEPTFGLDVVNNGDGSLDLRLVLNQDLDREITGYYSLFVVARDGGSPPLSGTLTLSVTVLDANDNNPVFANSSYSVNTPEDNPLETSILAVLATDPDEGLNGEVIYQWDGPTASSYGHLFQINNISGVISLLSPLDYETKTTYSLTVIASDRGASGVPSQVRVTVNVGDVNDFPPTISVDAPFTASGQIEVPENSDPGSYVGHVTVQDGDSGPSGQVNCIMYGGPFRLNPSSQNIYTMVTTDTIDRERNPQYTVTVQCADMGSPSITSREDVVVTILDKNDHAPEFIGGPYIIAVKENVTIGTQVTRVNATDADSGENARLIFTLQGDSTHLFRIDTDTGIVTTTGLLDYETVQQLMLTVVVSDNGGANAFSVNTTLTVNLIDVNDEKPEFDRAAYELGTFENQSIGTEIGTVTASDADGPPFDIIVFGIEGSNDIMDTFEISPTTGRITIRRSLDREYRSEYVFIVTASNPGYPDNVNTVYVSVLVADINDNAPQIIFPVPGNNTVHVPHLAPIGYFFARVSATDADMGINNRLTYSFARPVEDNVFDIDSFTGALSVRDDLSETTVSQYMLLLMVRDSGSPPQSAVAELHVIVNRSMIFLTPDGEAQEQSGVNLSQSQTILISLAMITVLLVTVLVVAIILVKRRQAKQEEDMLRNGGCTIVPDFSSSSDSASRSTKESSTLNDLNQSLHDSYEVQPHMDPGYDVAPKSLNTDYPNGNPPPRYEYPTSTMVKLQNNLPNDGLQMPPSGRYQPSTSGGPTNHAPRHRLNASPAEMLAEPWKLTQKELAVHRLVQQMSEANGEDSDSTSGCSADVSNTDSGRGPSEDGDRTSPPPNESRPLSPSQVGPHLHRPQKRKHGAAHAPCPPPRRSSSDHSRRGSQQGSGLDVKPGLEARNSFSNKQLNIPHNQPEYLQLHNMPVHKNPITKEDLLNRAQPYRPISKPHNGLKEKRGNKQPCLTSKPCYNRPPRNVSFADTQKAYEPLPRLPIPDYMNSLDRAGSVVSTIDESDSGSTTSGSYILGEDDRLGPRDQPRDCRPITIGGPPTHTGSFV